MKSYLIMMGVRLLEMKRILKDTGSVYLHCDPTASHYLKMLMDAVFGAEKFGNEIAWRRTPFKGSSKSRARQFGKSHDVILFYKGRTWNYLRLPYSDNYLNRFKHDDGDGRGPYRKTLLKTYSKETLKRRENDNTLIPPAKEGAFPSYKQYLSESPGGTPIDDFWADVAGLNPMASERTGYPTQKPLALLDRIIRASSNPGDMVLDPFCGCATACIAAEKLERHWAGIDLSPKAADLVIQRAESELGGLFKLHHREDIPRRRDQGDIPHYRTQKHTLFGRQEGYCNGCRIPFPFRNFTIDHVVPQSAGGTDHPENLQLLCGACNSTKGTRTQAHLLATLKRQNQLIAQSEAA